MSDDGPIDPTTSTDLDPTQAVAVPTAPLTPASDRPTDPVEQPVDPAVAWAAAVPVEPPASRSAGRARRLRWAAAIAVVALVLGASAAVAALITSGATASTVLGYVPAGSAGLRRGPPRPAGRPAPGGRRVPPEFPGFADQAALEGKLDEVLDEFVKKATEGGQSYTADIKPWFDGQLAFALGPLPPAASLRDPSASLDKVRALALISVKDAALADAWIDDTLKKAGVTGTPEPYDSTVITVVKGNGPDAPEYAYAIIGGKVVEPGLAEPEFEGQARPRAPGRRSPDRRSSSSAPCAVDDPGIGGLAARVVRVLVA